MKNQAPVKEILCFALSMRTVLGSEVTVLLSVMRAAFLMEQVFQLRSCLVWCADVNAHGKKPLAFGISTCLL